MIVAIMTTALSGTAWAQSDYSAVYTSNVTLAAGTNGSDCTVSGYDGIKVGTSKAGGSMTIIVPANTKYLHLHAAAWNGVSGLSLNITPNTYSLTTSIALSANSGIANNSPFTFSGDASSSTYYKVITFTNPLAAETTLTFTSSSSKRFVVWGVNAEEASSTPTCETPTFSPAAGVYTSAQNVTISTTTTGATIHYTIDGTDPTTSSATYSTPISVNTTTTIKAIATATGYDNSSVASATYNIVTIEHEGTEEDPYTVADARNAIDALDVTPDDVYATGIVSNIVEAYSSQHSNITFDISTDGETTSDQLRAYRCGGTDAASIQVGDVVVVSGDLTLYGSTYEFSSGCTLISRTSSSSKVAAGFSFSSNSAEADLADLSSFTAPTFSNPNNVTVTFTSSDPAVATVAQDGTVTPLAKGTTTITATSEETSEYLAGEASYTLTVTNSNAALVTVDADGNTTFDFTDNAWGFPTSKQLAENSYSNNGYTVTIAGAGSNNGFYFYESGSDLLFGKSGAYLTLPAFDYDVEKIVVVGKAGASTSVVQNIYVGDEAVSTATTGATGTNTYEIDPSYQAAGNIYTLKVTSAHNTQVTSIKVYKAIPDTRDEAEIAFSVETLTFTEGDTYTAPTFSNPNSVDVTFSTTNGSVASWNNGLVLGGSTGTATITATFDGDTSYKPATATLVVTINEDLGFATVKVGSGVYQKITSTSELEAGKRYLIVYEDGTDAKVFAGVTGSDIGDYVDLSIAESKINNNVAANAATPVVLQEDGLGNWYIMDGDKFLYWTSGNKLYSSSNISQSGNIWTINVDYIQNATTTDRYLQYNTGSPRFACYTQTQKDVVLYKELPVTLNSEGYATFASTSAVDFSDDSEFSAWKISSVSGTSINFGQITGAVEAGTGVLLKGASNAELTFVKAESGENISSTNKLVGFTTATGVTAGQYYGLSGKTFVKVNAGTVPAGKALLPASALGSNVKAFTFVFEEDDATAIEMVNGQSSMVNGPIYNLAGQRISKMQKGINIVNGKKILR